MGDNEVEVLAEVKAAEPEVAVRADDIFDGLAREVLAREKAHQEGRSEGRTLTIEIPEDKDREVAGGDLISYGRPDMIDALDALLDKDVIRHRGVEVDASVTEDPEKLSKLRVMADRQASVGEVTRRRRALEANLGLPALPEIKEGKLLDIEGKLPALPGSEVINEGGNESGTSESEV